MPGGEFTTPWYKWFKNQETYDGDLRVWMKELEMEIKHLVAVATEQEQTIADLQQRQRDGDA